MYVLHRRPVNYLRVHMTLQEINPILEIKSREMTDRNTFLSTKVTALLPPTLQRWPHHILKCRINSLPVDGLNHMNKWSKGEIADWGRGGENKQTLAFWFTPQRLEKTFQTPFQRRFKMFVGGKATTCTCASGLIMCCVWRRLGRLFFSLLTVPNLICNSWQPRLITV